MTSLAQRQNIMLLIDEALAAGARQARICEVIGLSPRTLQRWQTDRDCGDRRPERVQSPHNRYSELERQRILSIINSEEYGHLPPSQIVPRLADKGQYVASESTMYRLLRQAGQLQHRGRQRARQPLHKPRALSARAPNEIYSWDITYLPAAIKGQFHYLYLFLDLFSRKIVGWQVYDTEDSERASDVMRDICLREGISPGQVVLHSDNGGPMKGATMLATLRELGVAPSFSRPAVSNDNPYSESLFRTLKYRPQYSGKLFKSLSDARAWVARFVRWYNTEHRHSAIRFVTPEQRHCGADRALLAMRRTVYEAARAQNPHRWSGTVRNWTHIDVVNLNPERKEATTVRQKTILKRAA
jgi:transposase InsO family protein